MVREPSPSGSSRGMDEIERGSALPAPTVSRKPSVPTVCWHQRKYIRRPRLYPLLSCTRHRRCNPPLLGVGSRLDGDWLLATVNDPGAIASPASAHADKRDKPQSQIADVLAARRQAAWNSGRRQMRDLRRSDFISDGDAFSPIATVSVGRVRSVRQSAPTGEPQSNEPICTPRRR
jgi:hypothetical protein